MKRFEFRLDITTEQYLPYYRGEVLQVMIRLADGKTLRFPANLLRPFVRSDGIHGDFVLNCDDQHKGAQLKRRAARL